MLSYPLDIDLLVVRQLKGYEKDLSAATYCLHQEDHTLGNVIRYMLMKK